MSASTPTLWIIITGLALGSWLLRFSFWGIISNKELPKWAKRHLQYTVVAVMPGIIAPLVFLPHTTNDVFDLLRFVAATITLAIGDWAKSLLITIGTGGLPLYSMLNAGF